MDQEIRKLYMYSSSNQNVAVSTREKTDFVSLKEALPAIGITAPTFYRWIRAGRVDDCRVRGNRGQTLLSLDDVEHLRRAASHVDYAH